MIADPEILINVNKELNYIKKELMNFKLKDEVIELIDELRDINLNLWELEEAIRI